MIQTSKSPYQIKGFINQMNIIITNKILPYTLKNKFILKNNFKLAYLGRQMIFKIFQFNFKICLVFYILLNLSKKMGKTRNGGLYFPIKIISETNKFKSGFRENLIKMLQELDNGIARNQGISSLNSKKQFGFTSKQQEEQERKYKRHSKNTLKCSYFPTTMIQMLRFLSSLNTYNKIYGHFIIDKDFQILYADKLARELLEGSLSSFSSNCLLNFVVQEDRQIFIKKCQQSVQKSNWFDYLTYSKSSLRKYDLYPQLQNPTNLDYFFRYMKSLSSQITPISIDFTGYEDINEAFWNKNLISSNKQTRCFFFRTCYSLRVPNLDGYVFSKDNIINKFQTITENKKFKKGIKDQEKITCKINWNLNRKLQKNKYQVQHFPIVSQEKVPKNKRKIRKIKRKILKINNYQVKIQKKVVKSTIQNSLSANKEKINQQSLKHFNQQISKFSIKIDKQSINKDADSLSLYSISNELAQYQQQRSSGESRNLQIIGDIELQKRFKHFFKIRTDLSFEIRQDDDYISQFLA